MGWARGSQEVLTSLAKVSGHDRSSLAYPVLGSGTYLRLILCPENALL